MTIPLCYGSSDPAAACGVDGVPASPFTDARWLEAFRNENITPTYFRFVACGETVGVAAGLSSQSSHRLLQNVTRQLHLHTGPIPLDGKRGRAKDCLISLYDYALKNRFIGLFVGSYDYDYDYKCLTAYLNLRIREEYVIDLRHSLDDLMKKLNKTRRQTINKSTRLGISFEIGGVNDVIDLIQCLKETKDNKNKKGFGEYNPYYVKFLTDDVTFRLVKSGIARIFIARLNGELLSSCLVVVSKGGAYFLLGGSMEKGYRLNSTSFLDWRIIELLKAEGCESLNFGGVPPDDSGLGLANYKQSFGAEKVTRIGAYSYNLQMGSWRDWIARVYRKIS